MLPEPVLQQARDELLDWQGAGMSVMEMSHRGKAFLSIAEQAEADLRELLAIPDNYKVLFLQGGASTQFAMVPMNLITDRNQTVDYVNTGSWSKKAIKEAKLFGNVDVAYDSEPDVFNAVPETTAFQGADSSQYLYFVSNNTIYGTQSQEFPQTKADLVCDMSSDILGRRIDVSQFGIIFAGAQKNMGPAGCAVVIIRDDLLDKAPEDLPTMFKYKTHADKGSMFNTPPCFAIYCIGLVLKWLEARGGVAGIEEINRRKARKLYDYIDASDFYRGHALPRCRSIMNVTFNLPTPELEAAFVREATAAGFDGLKGHRSVGGCRASIYNAFPEQGVTELVAFMEKFEKANA